MKRFWIPATVVLAGLAFAAVPAISDAAVKPKPVPAPRPTPTRIEPTKVSPTVTTRPVVVPTVTPTTPPRPLINADLLVRVTLP